MKENKIYERLNVLRVELSLSLPAKGSVFNNDRANRVSYCKMTTDDHQTSTLPNVNREELR